MKKQQKNKQHTKRKAKAAATTAPESPDRRGFLKMARVGVLGGAAVVGAGWWVASGVRAIAREQDLSDIGSGTPMVVQIHDPSCSMCTELQRQARKALDCFDEAALLYRVANIRTEDGLAFSSRLGLPHVTLVLLDGDGAVSEVLQGVRQSEDLKAAFETHHPRARLS